MTNFNKALTIKEATALCKSKDGMNFPNTIHNRKMIAKVIDNHLKALRNQKEIL